jgi:hypothetical protein
VICPACGAGNVPGEAFCDFCGSPLEAPVPTAETTPELEPVASAEELEVPVAAAPSEEEDVTPAPTGAEATPTCPACGTEVAVDEAFCPNCGAALAEAPLPPQAVPDLEAEEPPTTEAEITVEVPEPGPAPVAPEEPSAPAVVEEAPVPPPTAEPLTCPACGAAVEAGDAFCSNCGAGLQEAPPTPAPQPVEAAPAAVTPGPAPTAAGPRLQVADSGAEIPLPAKDEISIGREDPVSGIYPDVDLTPHGGEAGGVSRKHARLIVEGDKYYVEDLDSTNFTFVNKQKLTPGTRHPVSHGDEIRFGRVNLVLQIT